MSNSSPPKRFTELQEQYPELFKAAEALGKAAREAGPLNAKVTQLVQLGAACALRSEGGVHSHARRAREAGATPEEIYHAVVALTSTIGFPTMVAAVTWVDDILHKD